MTHKKKTILQFVADGFEDLELWYPVLRLREEGAVVILAGEKAHHTYAGKHGVPCLTTHSIDEIDPESLDGILVPGGWAPDKLRRMESVLTIVKYLDKWQKPIGQICHAGWVLISAGILKGRIVTSTPGIRDDMINAGAEWVDEEVVVDGNLISSRRPEDLPAYMKHFTALLGVGYPAVTR